MKRILTAVVMVLVASSLCFAEEKAASSADATKATPPVQAIKKQGEKKVAKNTVTPKMKHAKVQKEQKAEQK